MTSTWAPHHLGVLDQHVDVLLGLGQLLQARLEAVDALLGLLALGGQEVLVELDELQERLGRGVVVAPLDLQEPAAGLVHAREGKGHELVDGGARRLLAEVDLVEELLGDAEQRALGPRLEPVDDGARDRRQEALRPRAEVVPDGRHREDHVQVRLDLLDEGGPAVLGRVDEPERLGLAAHGVDDVVLVLDGEQVGDLPGRQQVVDEHEELPRP